MTTKSSHTTFNDDGSITVTTENSVKKTVFDTSGDIISTMEIHDSDGHISAKTTERVVFNADGSIDNNVNAENI